LQSIIRLISYTSQSDPIDCDEEIPEQYPVRKMSPLIGFEPTPIDLSKFEKDSSLHHFD